MKVVRWITLHWQDRTSPQNGLNGRDSRDTDKTERHSKRVRGSPTGLTPQLAGKRKEERGSRKRLEFGSFEQPLADSPLDTSIYVPVSAWSTEETKALVEFMLFHDFHKWACTKDKKFWESTATFVRDRAERSQVRTGEYWF